MVADSAVRLASTLCCSSINYRVIAVGADGTETFLWGFLCHLCHAICAILCHARFNPRVISSVRWLPQGDWTWRVYIPGVGWSTPAGPILQQGHTEWPNEESIYLPFWKIRWSKSCESERWSSQTDDFNIDTCHFLTCGLALLFGLCDWVEYQCILLAAWCPSDLVIK